jgi:hypothetical protein
MIVYYSSSAFHRDAVTHFEIAFHYCPSLMFRMKSIFLTDSTYVSHCNRAHGMACNDALCGDCMNAITATMRFIVTITLFLFFISSLLSLFHYSFLYPFQLYFPSF